VLLRRRRTNKALFSLVVRALASPARGAGLEPGGDQGPVVRGGEPPERDAHVIEQLLRHELIRLGRQRRKQVVEDAPGRDAPFEHFLPQQHERRAAQIGILDALQRGRQVLERRDVEIEASVSADREDPLRPQAAGGA
jgi:hypothetical protein